MNIGEYHDRKKVLTCFYHKCYNDKQQIFYLPRFGRRRWAKPPLSPRNMNQEALMKKDVLIVLVAFISNSILDWSCADVQTAAGRILRLHLKTSGLFLSQ